VSKCVAYCILVYMTLMSGCDSLIGMVVPCLTCRHLLWAELRSVEAPYVMVYIEDDEQSPTYAEQVLSCPKCDTQLGNALGGVTPQEVDGAPWPR